MRLIKKIAAVAFVSCCVATAHAEQADVYLFLDADTAETKINGLDVTFRAELTDEDLTDRDFTHRPRVWITCYENGRQLLTVDTADDLDPWPEIKADRDLELDVKLISQTGSFADLPTRMNASRVTHLLKLNVDITARAEGVARTWLQGFPIKLTASPGNGFKDLNLVIFTGESNARFRAELASAVRGCEVLAGH